MRLFLICWLAFLAIQDPPIKPPKGNPVPTPDQVTSIGGAYHVCWSADSRRFASGPTPNGSIAIFTASEGRFANRHVGSLGKERLSAMALSNDGKILATAAEAQPEVRFWDAEDGRDLGTLKVHIQVRAMAWSPAGSHFALGFQDLKVKIYDAASRKELKSLDKFKHGVSSLVFSPDGKTLFTGGINPICAWGVPQGNLVREIGRHQTPGDKPTDAREVNRIAFSPDGKKLVTCGQDNRVRVWDGATFKAKAVASFQWLSSTWGGWLEDGRHLICGGSSSGLHIVDGATGKERLGFRTEGPLAPTPSPDGVHVLIGGNVFKTATLMKGISGEAEPEPEGKAPPEAKGAEEKPAVLVDNPDYKGWSGCKAGSMIRYRITTSMSTSEATFKLTTITPETAEIEQVFVVTSGGVKQTSTLPKSIPAKVNKGETAEGKRLEVVKEGTENVEVLGKSYKCRWLECKIISKQGSFEIARFEKTWRCAELPGGVAKLERRERVQDPPVTYIVEDFKFEK